MNDALLYCYPVIGGRKSCLTGTMPGLHPWTHGRTARLQSEHSQSGEDTYVNRPDLL
ncbi:MAG: hypothetical protein HQ580_04625 [Planctomycetes bacterium]|nr:hypothetical protein [Planctomycetota bacterium]